MTITVNGKVSTPVGLELEAISTERGVETGRSRHQDGNSVSLTVFGSKTIILREVPAGSDVEVEQGAQRHGDLNPPVPGKALEEGDLAPAAQELIDEFIGTRDRIVQLVGQLISLEGQPEAQEVYAELVQVNALLNDLDTRMEAYEASA